MNSLSVLFAASPVAMLAASSSDVPIPYTVALLISAIGAIVSGRFVAPKGWLVDEREARIRAENRADRYEAEINRLNSTFTEKFLPAIVESQQTMTVVTEIIQTYEAENKLLREQLSAK